MLSKYRFAFSMNNVWKSSNQKHNFGFYTSFGHKSYGYLNGYGLKESLLLDFGLYFSVLKK